MASLTPISKILGNSAHLCSENSNSNCYVSPVNDRTSSITKKSKKSKNLSLISSKVSFLSQISVDFCLQQYPKQKIIRFNFNKRVIKAQEEYADDGGVRKVLTPLQKRQLEMGLTKKRPVEELYKIRVDRNISDERIKELNVDRWSTWNSGGSCTDIVDYMVDEQIFIRKGEMHVKPNDNDRAVVVKAGDLVRIPKWMVATVEYIGECEQTYRFVAYGDDN